MSRVRFVGVRRSHALSSKKVYSFACILATRTKAHANRRFAWFSVQNHKENIDDPRASNRHVPGAGLEKGKAWYAQVLGTQPYFDEPFYVGFSVGGFELGLVPMRFQAMSACRPIGVLQTRTRS